jgi:LmbE family N-acetylglucosaminyl deacetylase
MKDALTRRRFVKNSLAIGGPALVALNALTISAVETPENRSSPKRLKVVCVGAHPDDPESGCAGTLAQYASQGHEVTIIYLTRGERGIKDKSNDEAAAIRSREAEAACKLIGAKPLFAGQIDGSTEFTHTTVDTLLQLVGSAQPDILYAHWPIDTHMDHQVASMCAICACRALPRRPRLFFFEVNTGSQSQGFFPNTYVDITAVTEKKRAALLAHSSQDGAGIWKQHHEPVAYFRGREAGVRMAEAFVQLNREIQAARLPGVS